MDTFPPTKQRPVLLKLAEALCSKPSALRRDECGDWAIKGRRGHIYAVPEGFQLMCGCDFDGMWPTANGWTRAKQRLAFGTVTQDGDQEGVIMLDRPPSPDEAIAIRKVMGIPKRTEYSEATIAAKRSQCSTWNEFKAQKMPKNDF